MSNIKIVECRRLKSGTCPNTPCDMQGGNRFGTTRDVQHFPQVAPCWPGGNWIQNQGPLMPGPVANLPAPLNFGQPPQAQLHHSHVGLVNPFIGVHQPYQGGLPGLHMPPITPPVQNKPLLPHNFPAQCEPISEASAVQYLEIASEAESSQHTTSSLDITPCDICDIVFTNNKQYQAHCQGFMHTTAENNLEKDTKKGKQMDSHRSAKMPQTSHTISVESNTPSHPRQEVGIQSPMTDVHRQPDSMNSADIQWQQWQQARTKSSMASSQRQQSSLAGSHWKQSEIQPSYQTQHVGLQSATSDRERPAESVGVGQKPNLFSLLKAKLLHEEGSIGATTLGAMRHGESQNSQRSSDGVQNQPSLISASTRADLGYIDSAQGRDKSSARGTDYYSMSGARPHSARQLRDAAPFHESQYAGYTARETSRYMSEEDRNYSARQEVAPYSAAGIEHYSPIRDRSYSPHRQQVAASYHEQSSSYSTQRSRHHSEREASPHSERYAARCASQEDANYSDLSSDNSFKKVDNKDRQLYSEPHSPREDDIPPSNEVTTLVVRSLPTRSSVNNILQGLYHKYKNFDGVGSIYVVNDSPESRYAIIKFEGPSEARLALEKTKNLVFLGSQVLVEFYRGNEDYKLNSKTSRYRTRRDIIFNEEGVADECSTESGYRSLIVRGLSDRTSENSLEGGLFHLYKKCGKLISVNIVNESSGERHAIVNFELHECAQSALELTQNKIFFGSQLSVKPHQTVCAGIWKPGGFINNKRISRTLFVGGLGKTVTVEKLRSIFSQYGSIIDIELIDPSRPGSDKQPFAFIEYDNIVTVVKAIHSMNGQKIGNNKIRAGVGKTKPTNCVWVDMIPSETPITELRRLFDRHSRLMSCVIDRGTPTRQALFYYSDCHAADETINRMRGGLISRQNIQIDFASKALQKILMKNMDNPDKMEMTRSYTDRNTRNQEINKDKSSKVDDSQSNVENKLQGTESGAAPLLKTILSKLAIPHSAYRNEPQSSVTSDGKNSDLKNSDDEFLDMMEEQERQDYDKTMQEIADKLDHLKSVILKKRNDDGKGNSCSTVRHHHEHRSSRYMESHKQESELKRQTASKSQNIYSTSVMEGLEIISSDSDDEKNEARHSSGGNDDKYSDISDRDISDLKEIDEQSNDHKEEQQCEERDQVNILKPAKKLPSEENISTVKPFEQSLSDETIHPEQSAVVEQSTILEEQLSVAFKVEPIAEPAEEKIFAARGHEPSLCELSAPDKQVRSTPEQVIIVKEQISVPLEVKTIAEPAEEIVSAVQVHRQRSCQTSAPDEPVTAEHVMLAKEQITVALEVKPIVEPAEERHEQNACETLAPDNLVISEQLAPAKTELAQETEAMHSSELLTNKGTEQQENDCSLETVSPQLIKEHVSTAKRNEETPLVKASTSNYQHSKDNTCSPSRKRHQSDTSQASDYHPSGDHTGSPSRKRHLRDSSNEVDESVTSNDDLLADGGMVVDEWEAGDHDDEHSEEAPAHDPQEISEATTNSDMKAED